ncbi:hypothetical protein H0A36_15045 [Endozoicomonas sp. SM1973]|uniref:Solute-binding protein family 3/N-terminal domain-containing protein n=1 Tax=Spartinivicinus marinus TaxID=2994442 RepID=A0A853I6P8_9GAMM|nr:hypothetical protein [Spartinivicinus marinus]MCX4026253.1 hypothetical protein [Spartinivicinus marinus]NYZ67332.1 hypothetical protein [Spartinivicinus marinus]
MLLKSVYSIDIQQAIKKGYLTIETTKSIDQNLRKLAMGRIDLVSLNYDVGITVSNDTLSKEERGKILPHPDPLRVSLYRLLLNKKNKERSLKLLDKFNTGLYLLNKENKIKEMLDASKRGSMKLSES